MQMIKIPDLQNYQMASVRQWSPSKSENRAMTQKVKSNRQKSQQLNLLPKPDIQKGRSSFFSKDSFYDSEQKSNYESVMIESSLQSGNSSNGKTPLLQSYKDSKISRTKTKRIDYQQQPSFQNQRSSGMRDTHQQQRNAAIKKLEEISVDFKRIDELQNQRRLQEEAKQFIFRLRREKREFDGKIYLKKRQEEQKKKLQYYDEISKKVEQRQIQKIHRIKEIQKRLQNFKSKEAERDQQIKRQRSHSLATNKLSKLKLALEKHKLNNQPKAVESPTYRIGKKYLQQAGRIKKRVKTESSYYYDLSQEQRLQLDKIRQKIDTLTKSLK